MCIISFKIAHFYSRTKLEFDRRMGLVNQLKVSLKSYERMLLDDSSSQNKESLFNINNVERNLDSIESEETMNYNSNQLLMQQDRILAGNFNKVFT